MDKLSKKNGGGGAAAPLPLQFLQPCIDRSNLFFLLEHVLQHIFLLDLR